MIRLNEPIRRPVSASPPGPRARFPLQLALQFRRDPLGFLERLAREYGDIVQFSGSGQEYVLLNHPDYIHDVLVTQADGFVKGPALKRAQVTLGQGLLTSEGELHRRQRRLSQPAFHPQSVATYGRTMVAHASRVRESWADGDVIDVREEMMELALQIVAEALFGADIGPQARRIGEAMNVTVGMFTRAMVPWGPLLQNLPLRSNRRFEQARRYLFDMIEQTIRQRRQGGEQRQDFLSLLLRARDTDPAVGTAMMSDEQVRDEAITIFMAGHETTANALTFAWYLLSQHPEIRERMNGEIDQALDGWRQPTVEDLPRLSFVRAVLAESIRLYPPVWVVGRQALREWEVGGYHLPAGSTALMSQWVMHRDARYWPDPLRFDPSRWEGRSERPRYAYFPFGGGPRGCIGEPFAWMEGVLVLTTLAQRWRLDLLPGERLELLPTITLRPKRPLRMVMHRR